MVVVQVKDDYEVNTRIAAATMQIAEDMRDFFRDNGYRCRLLDDKLSTISLFRTADEYDRSQHLVKSYQLGKAC